MSFTTLGLSDALVRGILATGYTEPTEIQLQTIPLAVQGHDVIGLAQTGTGKTAAFVLPMLNKLDQSPAPNPRHVRALVLAPTRELATQVESSIKKYGRFMKLFSATIYGGTDMYHQITLLRKGFDILIATPGRLIDHLRRNTVNLSQVEMLVLDEADRMLDMGFVHDVKKIIAALPENRQTLLFSATMSGGIKTLTSTVQRSPKLVQIGEERKPADSVTQKFYSVSQDQKSALLLHILDTVEMDSVLVFSRTKHGADKIQHRLEQRGITSVAIHSNRTQSQREKALKGFRQKHFKVLVATDIAARGIDIQGISHVINYDTPNFAEDYVHRIGRTGRAAATGDAITFVARDEYKHFRRIAEFIGKRFEINRYPDFAYTDTADLMKEEGMSRHRPERESRRERSASKPRHQKTERRSERDNSPKSSGFGKKKMAESSSADGSRPQKPKSAGGSAGGFKRPKFASKGKENPVEYASRDKKAEWQSMLSDEEAYNKVQRKAGNKE